MFLFQSPSIFPLSPNDRLGFMEFLDTDLLKYMPITFCFSGKGLKKKTTTSFNTIDNFLCQAPFLGWSQQERLTKNYILEFWL